MSDETAADPAFLDRLRTYEGRAVGPAEPADDPVNVPMIRHWVEAMGEANPVHLDDEAARATGRAGVVAPPTMLQVWTMKGLKAQHGRPDNLQTELLGILDEAGFTSVVATNTDQEYLRELVPGDHLSATSSIESVSEQKTTGLGVGHFVTTRTEFHDQHGELVGTMTFRILKFKPAARPAAEDDDGGDERPPRPRPSINRDNAFWFEGVKDHRLLIQRCQGCGELRHPPGPACPACGSMDWDTVEATGRGTVYSFTVNHHPKVPTASG
ncbi:MAG: MaoC family dehydratase N-terminal domain-containing protein [Actinomycetota bacterium]